MASVKVIQIEHTVLSRAAIATGIQTSPFHRCACNTARTPKRDSFLSLNYSPSRAHDMGGRTLSLVPDVSSITAILYRNLDMHMYGSHHVVVDMKYDMLLIMFK